MSGRVWVAQRDMRGWASGRLKSRSVANDFAPVVPGRLQEFAFGELLVLCDDLGKISEGRGGFGLDVALGGGGEKSAESGSNIAIGEDLSLEEMGDAATDFESLEVFAVLLAVVVAEAEVVRELGEGAAASVGEGEVAQVRTIRVGGHRNLQRVRWKRKSPREEARA